jgi:hypothetical protein
VLLTLMLVSLQVGYLSYAVDRTNRSVLLEQQQKLEMGECYRLRMIWLAIWVRESQAPELSECW